MNFKIFLPPALFVAALMLQGCQKPSQSSGGGDSFSPEGLAKRGQAVYAANCTACHNANPALPGALGPAIAGSSFELIEARVMYAKYPEGYVPKGAPGGAQVAMPAMPYLQNDLPALHAYLRNVKP